MIKAIVYHTKTGYTERYAKILSERTGLPCYNMNEALGQFGKNDEVIFMGNIMTGTVKGYKKAHRNFTTCFVVGVGISYPTNEIKEDVRDRTDIVDEPFYLLRGGIDYKKISKFKGFFLKKMAEIANAGREKGEDHQHDQETIDILMEGGDYFNPEYLQPVVDWYNQHKDENFIRNRAVLN